MCDMHNGFCHHLYPFYITHIRNRCFVSVLFLFLLVPLSPPLVACLCRTPARSLGDPTLWPVSCARSKAWFSRGPRLGFRGPCPPPASAGPVHGRRAREGRGVAEGAGGAGAAAAAQQHFPHPGARAHPADQAVPGQESGHGWRVHPSPRARACFCGAAIRAAAASTPAPLRPADPTLLASTFQFVGPVVGPLSKTEAAAPASRSRPLPALPPSCAPALLRRLRRPAPCCAAAVPRRDGAVQDRGGAAGSPPELPPLPG